MVSKRLGRANGYIPQAIYAHAMKDDEATDADLWDEATSEIIGRTQKVRTEPSPKTDVIDYASTAPGSCRRLRGPHDTKRCDARNWSFLSKRLRLTSKSVRICPIYENVKLSAVDLPVGHFGALSPATHKETQDGFSF